MTDTRCNHDPLSRRELPGSVRRGSGESVLVLEADQERLKRHEQILAALGCEPVGFTEPAEAAAACRWELRNNLGAPTRFDAVILAAASAREFGAPALAGVGIVEVIRQPLMSAELAGALGRCLSVSGPASHRLRRATADNDVILS